MTKHEELSEFLAIKDELLSLLQPLDDARLNQVPFPGSWTAGQLGDHLLKSYRLVDLSKVQATPSRRRSDEKGAQIDAVFLDFTQKYQPPEVVVPSSGTVSGKDLRVGLQQVSDSIADYVRAQDLSFTCREFEVIGFGDLTAQEWIRFLTAHSKRHVRQLRQILGRL